MLTTVMLMWTLWQGDMIVARYATINECIEASYKVALVQGKESTCMGPYSLSGRGR